jgi:hypothetical protein
MSQPFQSKDHAMLETALQSGTDDLRVGSNIFCAAVSVFYKNLESGTRILDFALCERIEREGRGT